MSNDIETGLREALLKHVRDAFPIHWAAGNLVVSPMGPRLARVSLRGCLSTQVWTVSDRGTTRCILGEDSNRG